MPRKGRRKASLRSTGKVRESDILERARALADDPSLAIPICEGPCVLFSPVKAAQRAIPKIHAARDDEAKLLRFAKSGNDLARAYAATLIVANSDKIPYVAELKMPSGSAPYVVRGSAKPFFVAGLQNHTDRALRLLAMMPWAKKRGIHAFSADRGIVCTGKSASPPRDFVEEEMDELGLEGEGARFTCGHAGDKLVLHWRDAGVDVLRCEACVGEGSTLNLLLRHMTGPRLLAGFDVSADLAPLEGEPIEVASVIPEAIRRTYLTGSLADRALIDAARAARIEALRALPRRAFVAGGKSFADADAFLAALQPTPGEERALRAAFARHEKPVVLDKPTIARALADLWPEHGEAMLEAAAGSATIGRELHKPGASPEEVADIVRRAAREGSSRALLASIPSYQNLPPAASVADTLARVFRASGQDAAVRAALERAGSGKQKGVCLAFLQELGGTMGQEWRFSPADKDVAASVQPAAARLLKGPAESYHEALREASLLAGETVSFSPR